MPSRGTRPPREKTDAAETPAELRADAEKLHAKLEAHRQKSERLTAKLAKEQKRSARLAAELEAARAESRAARFEAERALADSLSQRAELELAAGPANDAGRSGAGFAEADDPAQTFELARRFQAQGAVNVAATAYRRVGPALKDLLAQEGHDGGRIAGPDFLIIGSARAGTTWLKKALSRHPQVFILSGEHHYFSNSSHMPADSYVARFAGDHSAFQRPGIKASQYAPPVERRYGEKSTTYLSMPDAQIDLCAALFPEVRLVCMVRDPVQRVWSHLKHLAAAGGMKFSKMAEAPPWAQVEELIRQCRYEEHLVRWASHFDPEQILLVDFERIAREPDAVFQEIVRHIGAGPPPGRVDPEEVGGTARSDIPPDLAKGLHDALDGERFDIPYLRQAMERAAEARRQRGAAAPGGRLVTARV
jgi:hypothetical protein